MLTEQERFLLRTLTTPLNQPLENNLDIENLFRLIRDYLLFGLAHSRLSKGDGLDEGFGLSQEVKEELLGTVRLQA